LANYQNPELDLSNIIAYSGEGTIAIYTSGTKGTNEARLTTIKQVSSTFSALNNLDISIIMGLKKDGINLSNSDPNSTSPNVQSKDKVAGTVYFNSNDEAFDYLKRVIAAGHPVQVVLNRYYLYDDFAPVSSHWKSDRAKENGGNWFTVTGYDNTYIYVNDPTDPTGAATNLPAKVNNFRLAWEKTTEFQDDPPAGPYMMFYLSQAGTKKSTTQIIAWNVNVANSAPTNIRQFSTNPNSSRDSLKNLVYLAEGRLAFATFLDNNGKKEAAALYRESGNLFATLSDGAGSMSRDLNTIADKEEQALILLSK